MCKNVLLNLSINTTFKSLYVENSSVSYSLHKDLNLLLQKSLPLSSHNFFGFLCSPNTILKPLVTDKPDLFFNAIAHVYFVNISITVNINFNLILFLFRDDLSIN